MKRICRSYTLLLALLALPALPFPVWAQGDADDAFRISRNLYRDAGDYATAAKLFAEFLQNHPTSQHVPQARLLLARSYRRGERCDLAVEAYEDFFRQHPDHIDAAAGRSEQAECLGREGRFLEAARAHANVQRLFPTGEFAVPALLAAADNYVRGQDPAAGARFYNRIVREYPGHAQVHLGRYRLAKLLFAQGQTDEAVRLLAVVAGSEPDPPEAPSALLLSGRIGLFLDDLSRSKGTFEQLRRRFPKAAQADSADLYLASYLYEKGRFKEAAIAFEKARQRVGDPRIKNQVLVGLADAQRQSGRPDLALDQYRPLSQRLEAADPLLPRVRLGLAIALGQTDRVTQAAGLLQELIQGDPSAPESTAGLRELGALYRRRGDYGQAIGWYRRYLEVAGPEAADRNAALFALAQIQTAAGYYEEAVRIYRELVQNAPALAAQAQFGLARAFEQSGLPRLALREFTLYLERFPGHTSQKAARQRVEYLREFTVLDAGSLNRALQQALIDELSGRPREQVLFGLARDLLAHLDMANAVRTFETYVATYGQGARGAEAQYYLAESLFGLARQHRLENRGAAADSLGTLALQELRILAGAATGPWTQKAQLRLVRMEADAAPDSLRLAALEKGYADFLAANAGLDNPHRARALLGLADAQRHRGERQPAKLDTALRTYHILQSQYAESPLRADALFGIGLARARQGGFATAIDSLDRFLRSFPGHPLVPEALFEVGRALLLEGRTREAVARYQELLLAHPTFPQRHSAQLQLAEIHYGQAEYGQVIALLQPLSEDSQDRIGRVRWRLAQAYHRHQRFERALDLYRALAALPGTIWPDSIHFAHGQLLEEMGRADEAIEQYLAVRRAHPESPLGPQGALRAAHLYFVGGDNQKAHDAYRPLLAGTDQARAHGENVLALYRLDRPSNASKAAGAFGKRFKGEAAVPWTARFELEEGLYHLRRKAFDKALKIFRKLDKGGGPSAADGAYHAAMALWEKNQAAPSQEDGARALEALNKFVRTHPESPRSADVHFLLGNYNYQVTRNYLLAAGAYKAVLNGKADASLKQQAVWRLLRSYEKAFEYDEAYRTAQRLLSQFPNHPQKRDVQLSVGILLKEKGQYAKAIAHLESTLEWAQGDQASEAYFYIGQSYQNMGEYRKAIETYYRVSYYGGQGSTAWITNADYQRAHCHEALDERASAIGIYERIVRREGSESPFGSAAQERIEALKQSSFGDRGDRITTPN